MNTKSKDSINTIESQISSFRRSDIVQEIVSKRPSFMVLWGNTIFLFIFISLIILTWFLHYPDIVKSSARLSTINAPKQVVSRVDGKLNKLFVKDQQLVNQGQIIGFIESTAVHEDIITLSKIIDSSLYLISYNKIEKLPQLLNKKYLTLGELQTQYEILQHLWANFKTEIVWEGFVKKKNSLLKDIVFLKRLHSNYFEQQKLLESDYELANSTLAINQKLKDQQVISEFDLRNEKSKVINKQLSLPIVKASIISNEILQNEKAKEIRELESTIEQQKSIFEQGLSTFKSNINKWSNLYIVRSPISGKICFDALLQENQQLQNGQVICFVNSLDTKYYAEIFVPQSNFGKVKIGQNVFIKLDSYSFEEFGSLPGVITSISQIPSEKGYWAKVEINDTLQTTYNKTIPFRSGLSGSAEIITQDLRLFNRIYYSITKNISRS